MSPKQMTTIRVAPDLLEVMRAVRDQEGVPMARQVDFAMREWLAKRGRTVKADRKRAVTRKRP